MLLQQSNIDQRKILDSWALKIVGWEAGKTEMSHDSRSSGVISFPIKCLFFFRRSRMRTVFFEGHLQPPSLQIASLSCVSHSPLHAPHMLSGLGVSPGCGWPGIARLERFAAHCESCKTTYSWKVGGVLEKTSEFGGPQSRWLCNKPISGVT